ncbi:MAG TPA: EAL domain-containing protein [Pyrinomonadaceae bacterium]|jgi:diguanylate cyclase (GGDEF)-like protein
MRPSPTIDLNRGDEVPAAALTKTKILIIDDDEQIRGLLLKLLGNGYDCCEAESAEQALTALAADQFDLVISDIQMGGMSGLELVPHVHSIAPDCVVLMISGQSTIETAIEAMHAGAFDYIMKPFDPRQVQAAVERALNQSLLLKEKRRYKDDLEILLQRRTAEVNRLAYYDTLTDLPNRILFEDRVGQAVAVAQRSGEAFGILFIAPDRLKKVNETLGHVCGDWLLKEVADRLRGCVTQGDTVARFGDDEFAFLIRQIGETKDVVEIIRSVQEALKPSVDLEGQEVFASASIGVSLFPLDGNDCQSLLKNAGAALYRAKKAGGNNYQFYMPEMHELASKRLTLETSLRHAIENEEFVLHYQPRAAVDSMQITGVEALIRWQHPQLGLLWPAEFIPLAEDTGLIIPIGEWVVRVACRQNKTWQDEGFTPMRMAVNIAAQQLRQPNIAKTMVKILGDTGLAPRHFELELTETSIMNNAEFAIDVLGELKQMGVKISIDDFGTGFSSLSYLKRLPINALKIDQSFVRDVTTDPNDASLVMAIITLAHNLKLEVVAEGVETEEQLNFLRLLRCDEIQGFLFSKGLPAEELAVFMRTHTAEQHTMVHA